MNWEQKFAAIQSLCIFSGEVNLRMRKPGDWYVHASGVNRIEGSVQSGGITSGAPHEAVEQFWEWATDPDYYLVIGSGRQVKWNGFMWIDVPKK